MRGVNGRAECENENGEDEKDGANHPTFRRRKPFIDPGDGSDDRESDDFNGPPSSVVSDSLFVVLVEPESGEEEEGDGAGKGKRIFPGVASRPQENPIGETASVADFFDLV